MTLSHNGRERAVVWCAVSSEEQAAPDLPSLDEQERAGREYCEQQGHVVVRVLRAEGFSRFENWLDRMMAACPAYDNLVRMIERREVTQVVCLWYHRLWRRAALGAQLFALADECDVHLFAIKQPIARSDDYSAMLLRAIYEVGPEHEIRQLIERRRMGLRGRAEHGKAVQSRAPYGYRLVGHRKDRRLVVNEAERGGVERVMEMRAMGMGYNRIAHALEAEGIICPMSEDGSWSRNTVRWITRSPTYAGYIRYRDWTDRHAKGPRRPGPAIVRKGEHEPIISQELWEAVQRVNKSQRREYTYKT